MKMREKKPKPIRRRKCKCCQVWFYPQPHNAYRKKDRPHQRYCTHPVCRRASKEASKLRWLRTTPDAYRGAEAVSHTQQWREKNPYYWRRKSGTTLLVVRVHIPTKKRPRGRIRARAVIPKTGALQNVSCPQHAIFQLFRLPLESALPNFSKIFSRRWYPSFMRRGPGRYADRRRGRGRKGRGDTCRRNAVIAR